MSFSNLWFLIGDGGDVVNSIIYNFGVVSGIIDVYIYYDFFEIGDEYWVMVVEFFLYGSVNLFVVLFF